ncbi:hypothetical protein DNTS_026697, partial [Danionella cerebrum]
MTNLRENLTCVCSESQELMFIGPQETQRQQLSMCEALSSMEIYLGLTSVGFCCLILAPPLLLPDALIRRKHIVHCSALSQMPQRCAYTLAPENRPLGSHSAVDDMMASTVIILHWDCDRLFAKMMVGEMEVKERPRPSPDYLMQLLNEKKLMTSLPNLCGIFTHLERLLDEDYDFPTGLTEDAGFFGSVQTGIGLETTSKDTSRYSWTQVLSTIFGVGVKSLLRSDEFAFRFSYANEQLRVMWATHVFVT